MNPVDLLDDHTRRPRNLGKLIGASAVGDVGSIIAGDALRFYVVVDAGVVIGAEGHGEFLPRGPYEMIKPRGVFPGVFNPVDQVAL